jgi:hypothetical protein
MRMACKTGAAVRPEGSQETQQALCVEPIGFGASMVNLGQRQKTPGLIGITRSPRQTARQPERKILALTVDGSKLGRRGHAGSRQGL